MSPSVWGVVKPSDAAVVPVLLGGLIIALVAGFGTTALIFMPMLKLFSPSTGESKNDVAAAK